MENEMLRTIAKEVKDNDGNESYDTWGDPERSNKFNNLKFHLTDKRINGFKIDGEIYVVEFRHSNGRTSMGGTPDSILVSELRLL